MFPQTSNLQNNNKQENPADFSHPSNPLSPIRPSGNQQKRAQQQNVTPFTKFINQLSPISKISKEASLELQNYKNIEPTFLKKQKLNYYQTPSPKAPITEQSKIDVSQIHQKTSHKFPSNKNITYIKIKSPIINLNYQKASDLEDELNIYKCSESNNLESIIPTNLNENLFPQQQKLQTDSNEQINPDISNFIYEYKFNQNKSSLLNRKLEQQQNSIDSDEYDSDELDDQDKEFFDEFSLHDSDQDQICQENEKIEENKEIPKDISTAKKQNENNNLTFSQANFNSQQQLEHKILKFEQFETPKQTRGRKPQKFQSNHHTLSEFNLLKTKQQLKQKEKQEQLEHNQQLQLNKQLNVINDQPTNQSVEKKRIGCNCKKSRCLKLYCDCFANGQFCTSECNCQNCANKEENEEERYSVMLQLIERNPCAFKPKVDKTESTLQEESHVRGCNCTKSGCIKKYCECFQAGVKCTSLCKCENCQNREESVNLQDNQPELSNNKITFSKKTQQLTNNNNNQQQQQQQQTNQSIQKINNKPQQQVPKKEIIKEEIVKEQNSPIKIDKEPPSVLVTKSKRIVKKSTYFLSPTPASPKFKQTARKTRRRY